MHRSFEWYWNDRDEMPGLDSYEKLNAADRARILATLEHWGSVLPGGRPLESRVNEENAKPLIVAAKAGGHRFPAFHAGDDVWVITGHYKKKGGKLDKSGKREVQRAMRALREYQERVSDGTYYERT